MDGDDTPPHSLSPVIHISGYAPGLNVHCDRYLSVLAMSLL